MPNCSGRMDNLRAAILRPQLHLLDENCKRWNQRHQRIMTVLRANNTIALSQSHESAAEVFSSFQFSIPSFSDKQNQDFLDGCLKRGVELKWFGDKNPVAFTSRYESWQYLNEQTLEQTNQVLHRLYDCRIPLTFSEEECESIALIIADEANGIAS